MKRSGDLNYSEAHKSLRMAEDLAKIRRVNSWPLATLQMKTQPWVEELEFGHIDESDLLAVHMKPLDGSSSEVRHYPSLEKLVEHWSVD